MEDQSFSNSICSWEDLSYTDALQLLDPSISNQGIVNKLEEILSLDMQTEDRRELKRLHITKDLYYNAITFARRENFNPQQLSAMFTIIKTIHKLCISTSYDNISVCYQTMKDLLISHSVHRPPFSIQLYSLEQVRNIMEYILQSYFRHFKLYKYAFTKRVLLDLKVSYEGVEVTPPPSTTHLVQNEENALQDTTPDEGEEIKESSKTDLTGDQQDNDDELEDVTLVSQEHQQLQHMVAKTLNDQMKTLKLTVEKELIDSNTRLSEKLEALETEFVTSKGKKAGK